MRFKFTLHLLGLCLAFGAAAKSQPNIIFVLSDDHRADVLGAADHRLVDTPHLDKLAAEGVRFPNAFSVTATCSPSRAAFLTGMYPHAAGAPHITSQNNTFLYTRTTFPQLLQQSGYHTAYFGKWHLGQDEHPQRGFDHWAGWEKGVPRDQVFYVNGEKVETKGFTDDALSKMAADYIREEAPKDKPFLAMVCLRSPHLPFAYPKRYEDFLDDTDVPKPATYEEDYGQSGRDAMLNRSDIKITNNRIFRGRFKNWDTFVKSYLRAARSIDDSVGRIMEAVEAAGLGDNTIIVYSSDHGYSLGEHGLMEKHFAYEPNMRIPFIMRWAGRIPPGITPEQMILNIDLAPTLLSWAGVPVPEDMQGSVLTPLLRDGETPLDWRDDFLFVYESRNGRIPGQVAVRTQDAKLVTYTGRPTVELYDLKTDPDEAQSVAADPNYEKTLQDMEARLQRLKEESDYEPRPQRKTLETVYVARNVTPEQAEALSRYYQSHDFQPGAAQGLEWELLKANSAGKFTPAQLKSEPGSLTLLGIPIDLKVAYDPHVAIWVAPWPQTWMFWKGQRLWEYNPQQRISGNLANPPLNLKSNVVLLGLEDVKKPVTIYIEAPRKSIDIPGLKLK